jgi:hypothetical protein
MKKQHLVYHHYTDAEILSEEFFDIFIEDCLTAKPLFDLLNTPLIETESDEQIELII